MDLMVFVLSIFLTWFVYRVWLKYLTSLTGFINVVLPGACQSQIIPLFLGARLIAFNKKYDEVHPVAVGCVL
jgi:hypothetical protein